MTSALIHLLKHAGLRGSLHNTMKTSAVDELPWTTYVRQRGQAAPNFSDTHSAVCMLAIICEDTLVVHVLYTQHPPSLPFSGLQRKILPTILK